MLRQNPDAVTMRARTRYSMITRLLSPAQRNACLQVAWRLEVHLPFLLAAGRGKDQVGQWLKEWISQQLAGSLGSSSDNTDPGAMAFVVLMDAAESGGADDDLKIIMAGVKATTNAKQALRSILNKVDRDLASQSHDGRRRPRRI